MLILRGIVQVIGYFTGAAVGRLIDRLGERKILIFYYAGLALFFLGYGTITNTYILYGLFVVDSAFFIFVLALTTFVDKLVPPSEHTQTLSMGVAMDHAAAVTMPLLGGIVWAAFGYKWVFIAGAAVALLSVIPAPYIPKHIPDGASSSDAAP
jgi:predicted MFS family arabinose efflux permease